MPGVAVSHDVDIGSEAHRQAVEAAIHGTVKIPQDHVDVMESLRDSLGFERSVRQQAMGWKHKGGWKDVEANAVVTEGVWGVGIEGGIVVSDPVLGNLVTPKFVHRINLGMNRLKGRIPAGVFRVATLQELDLGFNRIFGPIPGDLALCPNLAMLRLGCNQLSGPLPAEFGRLTRLEVLELFDNRISGLLPPEIGDMASLRVLRLQQNELQGPLPRQLCQLGALQDLSLSGNPLEPRRNPVTNAVTKASLLPERLGDLRSLRVLQIEGTALSGPLPPSLTRLTQLQGLFLRGNELSGVLPRCIGNMCKLTHLRLADNQFTGHIPPTIGTCKHLQVLDLCGNQMLGSLPQELHSCPHLVEIRVFSEEGYEGDQFLRSAAGANEGLLARLCCCFRRRPRRVSEWRARPAQAAGDAADAPVNGQELELHVGVGVGEEVSGPFPEKHVQGRLEEPKRASFVR